MGEKSVKQVPIGGVACRERLSISDSLLENSNPDRLVEYIRAKRNLPHAKELFSNVFNKDKPRKSFKLQLEPYQNPSLSPETKASKRQTEISEISESDKQLNNTPEKILLPRIMLRKKGQHCDYHPHARKALFNELGSTIKTNEFLPPVFSTPLSFGVGDDQLSKNETIGHTNDNNRKSSQKKSLIRKTVKPLTSKELEAAKLIENLANEQMMNNTKIGSNISLNKSSNSQNLTLRISGKDNDSDEELCENLDISEKLILPDQIILNDVQQEENVNADLIKKSQLGSLQQTNQSLRENSNFVTQYSNDKKTSNELHVPETEEFEIQNISASIIIPETQENAIINNVQENASYIVNQHYQANQLENCDKTDKYLPPKSPNRRTFVIHKLNNTITPLRSHSISKENYISPKSVKISSPSQMSPLARYAHSKIRLNNDKTSENFKKHNLRSRIPKSIRTPSSIRNNSVNRNIQLSQNVNEMEQINDMISSEYRNSSLPMIVIPIHQTVNTSAKQTSPLPPPDGFCDDTILRSSNILKPKTNLKIIDNDNSLTYRIPSPLLDIELITDDEDITSPSQNNIENGKLINHKSPIKNNVANGQSNETMQAINLYAHRFSTKRKSSVKANSLIDCYYDEVNLKKIKNMEHYKREVEKLRHKYEINSNDSINIDLTTDHNNSNNITARFTPPPPIQLSDDDDFVLPEEYHNIDNQQQSHLEKKSNKINSIRINGSRTLNNTKRHHEISLDRNVASKSHKKQFEFIDSEKQNNNISHIGQETTTRHQNSHSFGKFSQKNRQSNANISMTKSRNSHKNKHNLPDNIADIEINNENILNNNSQSQFRKSSQSRDNHANNMQENMCKPNIISNIQIVPSSYGTRSKHSNSPLLSRCTSLYILEMNNFNRNNNELLESEEEVNSSGNKENHKVITHKSRSRKRIINNRKSSQSLSTSPEKINLINNENTIRVNKENHKVITHKNRSRKRIINNRKSSQSLSTSPEKMNLINNENTIRVNVDEEIVIDDPGAMDNYWRYSITGNKSKKVSIKSKDNEKDNSLKNFYLNVDKTINNINVSTLSGRRKLYSKGESDIELIPKLTPTKNTGNNNSMLRNKTLTTTTTLEENKRNHKNNSKQKDVEADWDSIDEFNVNNENHNSISNSYNKKGTNKTNNKQDNDVFKIPILPVPKTLKKNKINKHHNIAPEFQNENSKESVEPKPNQHDITNNVESDNTSKFGTPRRTSTKIAKNIEKYLKGGKKIKDSRKYNAIPSNVDNINADNTGTYRRSNRKPCPRIEYWTNDRSLFTIKTDIIIPVSKQSKKQLKNKSKIKDKGQSKNLQLIEQNNNKLVSLNEKNENEPESFLDPVPVLNNKPKKQSKKKSQIVKKQKRNEEPINEEHENQPDSFLDPVPVLNNKPKEQHKNKSQIVKKQKKNEEPIREEYENPPETTPDYENQLSQLVDILKESFTENQKNLKQKGLHKKSDVNNKKRYSNNNRKKYKNKTDDTINEKGVNIKDHTIIEPVPSSSKVVAAENEEDIGVHNYDSGNGTDVNDAMKGHDAFLWLKKLVDSNATKSNSKLLVERLTESQDLELAYFNDMTTVEKAGVEYYFCNTSTQNYGFIKIKPNLTKPLSKLKRFDINFILFVGELDFFVTDKPLNNIKAGAVIKIKRNSNYSITNNTDSDALLLFMKFE